jgi:hypothetical protein
MTIAMSRVCDPAPRLASNRTQQNAESGRARTNREIRARTDTRSGTNRARLGRIGQILGRISGESQLSSARSGRPERCTRGCHCGRQDRRVTAVGFRKMFVGRSGGRVFAVGEWWWTAGAEGGAGAGGELSGVSCGHQMTTGRAPSDAQPGDESSLKIARSGSQSGRLPQPTPPHLPAATG